MYGTRYIYRRGWVYCWSGLPCIIGHRHHKASFIPDNSQISNIEQLVVSYTLMRGLSLYDGGDIFLQVVTYGCSKWELEC